MKRVADVAIVGGGIMGASIAYHLALRSQRRVVVFEREEALGTQSTGKCAGGVRLQFSTPVNIAMSKLSIAALQRFQDELGEPVDFRQNGYLFALTDEKELAVFRENAARQRAMGVPVEVISPEEAETIAPEMRIDDVVGATFCAEDGIANPHAIVQGYAKGARERGVRIDSSAEVTAIEVSGGRVTAVVTRGERWEVGLLVNAAGPWAGKIGEMAGVGVPVAPYRRMVFVTNPLSWVRDSFPMIIDWGTGVYLHKEGPAILFGESNRDEPPSFNQQVDWEYLGTVGEHAVRRIPRMAEAEVKTAWAGLYEVSPDHNAIIGRVPEVENFVCANGFSGHGMMHAPAVGMVVAELILDGEARSVDITSYSPERFHRMTPPEHNVI